MESLIKKRLVPVDLLYADLPEAANDNPTTNAGPVLVPLVALGEPMDRVRHLQDTWKGRVQARTQAAFHAPPVVGSISRDRLVLESGVAAACLAKAAGKKWIKTRMSEEVSRRWDARSVDRLKRVVRQTSRKVFYNPIFHAAFRRARTSRPESIRLDRITRLLGPLGEGLRGLDIGCNMGYMTHAFQRLGVDMTGIDFDPYHLSVAEALSETYQLNSRFVCCHLQRFEPEGEYDVSIGLSVLYHLFFNQEQRQPEAVANRVGRLTRHAFFWESGDQPEKEIALIRTHAGLSEYRSLGVTHGTGKTREFGVFLRPGTWLSKALAARYEKQFPRARQRSVVARLK
jgi:SAM-dependent methyltransferase